MKDIVKLRIFLGLMQAEELKAVRALGLSWDIQVRVRINSRTHTVWVNYSTLRPDSICAPVYNNGTWDLRIFTGIPEQIITNIQAAIAKAEAAERTR